MNSILLPVLGAALAVAALAWMLRTFATRPDESVRMPEGTADADLEPEEPEAESGETVALSSDGVAFIPAGHVVQLVNPAGRRDAIAHGDLLGARVRRGAPDHDPWRLEAIGRDGEYRAWRFETQDAAHTALETIQRVVRPARDEAGEPRPPSDADYAEALQMEERIEAELALSSDPFEDEEGNR